MSITWISPDVALRVLTAASEDRDGTQVVLGAVGVMPVRWTLPAALAMARTWAYPIVWDDNAGLVLVGHDGDAAYSFAAINPATLPDPDDVASSCRGSLRLVHSATH